MSEILLAFRLLILGIGSCVGGPVLFATQLIPSTIAELEPGPAATVEIAETSGYLLIVTRPKRSGAGGLVRDELPEGSYGFQSVGGEPIDLDSGTSGFSGSTLDSTFMAVGGAELQPGSYRVITPELPAGWTVEVAQSALAVQSAEGVLGMGGGLMVVLVLGALMLLVGGVLLILGIVDIGRGSRAKQE